MMKQVMEVGEGVKMSTKCQQKRAPNLPRARNPTVAIQLRITFFIISPPTTVRFGLKLRLQIAVMILSKLQVDAPKVLLKQVVYRFWWWKPAVTTIVLLYRVRSIPSWGEATMKISNRLLENIIVSIEILVILSEVYNLKLGFGFLICGTELGFNKLNKFLDYINSIA